MRKMSEYIISEWENGNAVSLINEYRTKGSTNKKADEPAPDLEDVKGKDEDENGSEGMYSVDAPTEDDITKGIDKATLNKNKKRILMRLKANKPFFIQGEAGWGKTSIITALAKAVGRTVITVYLDKAEATDLGGIPVPAKSKKGADFVKHLLPEWAKLIYDNRDTKFLLFFDEMNQAAPDVMNALMPIVLKTEICGIKFDNFIVGAAGNFESENGAVNELSGPLLSRFGGVITWESGDWKDAFAHLHKKWDDKLSKRFLDFFEANAPKLFKNPRDVESFILETVSELKASGDVDYFDADDYLDQLKDIAKDDLGRTEQETLKKLAEEMFKFVNNVVEDKDKEDKNSRKNREMVPDNVVDFLAKGMKAGYIEQEDENTGKKRKYGISRENIFTIEEWDFPREMLERTINKIEADGIKFKYEKDEEWKKAGYEDPNAE